MVYELGLEKTTLCFIIFLSFVCFSAAVYFLLYLKKHNLFGLFLAFISTTLFIFSAQVLAEGAVFYNTSCFNSTSYNTSQGNATESSGFNCAVYYTDLNTSLLLFLFFILSSALFLFSIFNLLFNLF